jgi:DNA polymerase
MTTLHWDCETRSTVDLRKAGVYVYGAHPTTEVLTIGYALNDAEPVWFMPGDDTNAETHFVNALFDAERVCAHNAGFERRMLTDILHPRFDYPLVGLQRWDCTAARAAIQALPRSLDGALKALGTAAQKDKEGHALMMRMCKPRRVITHNEPGFANAAAMAAMGDLCFTMDGPHRVIEWWADPARIERLAAYMLDDVRGEATLDRILAPMPDALKATWCMIEDLNDNGVPADVDFINSARWLAHEAAADLDVRMKRVTSGAVPKASNVVGLKRWLEGSFGIDCGGMLAADDENENAPGPTEDVPAAKLDKRRILDLLADPAVSEIAKEALRIRQQAGKTSVKKYDAMLARVSADNRVRGNLVFHAASTGRLAGAGVQMQNMIRDVRKDWEAVYADMNVLSLADFEAKHGPAMTALSQMIRGFLAIPAGDDAELWWCDYAAVEARGVAWLSGCTALTQVFRDNGPVYEIMAHAIYPEMSVAEIKARDKAGEGIERFVGKQVVLGCGYGMGWLKFIGHCDNFSITVPEEVAQLAVSTYRTEYAEIPGLWKAMEEAAKAAIQNPGRIFRAGLNGCIAFVRTKGWLKMRLPSGRVLWYCRPRLVEVEGKFGVSVKIEYDAQNSMTKKWGPERTWGGKLTENAVQGLCFDLIDHAKQNLRRAGYDVLLSVHDEIIARLTHRRIAEGATLDEMLDIMCRLPEWAAGFPLKAEGKKGRRYSK